MKQRREIKISKRQVSFQRFFIKTKKTYISTLFYNPAYLLPLFAISVKEVAKLYFLVKLKSLSTEYSIDVIIGLWMALQIIFSTVQGMISDRYCRKQMLAFTLAATAAAILFLNYSYIWIALIIDGVLANTTPIGRAAYLDQFHNVRKHQLIADGFIAQAIVWFLICFNKNIFNNYTFYLSLAFSLIAFVLVLLFFFDNSDRKKHLPEKIYQDIKKKFFTSWFVRLMIAFFLLELCYFFLPYFSEENLNELDMQKSFVLLGIGVTGGCILTKYFHFPSRAGVMVIFMIYSFFFTLNWLASIISKTSQTFPINQYLLFSFIGGASLVLIYACFSDISKSHEEGFVFGLLESIDSFAEFVTPLIIGIFSIKRLTYAPFIVILFIAFFLVVKKKHLNQQNTPEPNG